MLFFSAIFVAVVVAASHQITSRKAVNFSRSFLNKDKWLSGIRSLQKIDQGKYADCLSFQYMR